MRGFWKMMFGIPDERRLIEETLNSIPTAGLNDDGAGWERMDDPEKDDPNWMLNDPIIHQREARYRHMIPDSEIEQWQEHSPGLYHRKRR